jgi:hypothetical protein
MKAVALGLLLLVLAPAAEGRGLHPHRGWHHAGRVWVHRPGVVIGGVWGGHPVYPPYYPWPYYYGPYPVWTYPPPPPPDDPAWQPPADDEDVGAPPPLDAARASYGLVQLRGIPNGATVELDGRLWLTADDLDERWLALPDGEHTLVVRREHGEPLVRRVDVRAGRTHVVRFAAAPAR